MIDFKQYLLEVGLRDTGPGHTLRPPQVKSSSHPAGQRKPEDSWGWQLKRGIGDTAADLWMGGKKNVGLISKDTFAKYQRGKELADDLAQAGGKNYSNQDLQNPKVQDHLKRFGRRQYISRWAQEQQDEYGATVSRDDAEKVTSLATGLLKNPQIQKGADSLSEDELKNLLKAIRSVNVYSDPSIVEIPKDSPEYFEPKPGHPMYQGPEHNILRDIQKQGPHRTKPKTLFGKPPAGLHDQGKQGEPGTKGAKSKAPQDLNETTVSFKQYYENCNVCAGELEPGDHIENINPDCDHFKSKGVVIKIKKIPQDEERTAGKVVIYKVSNNSSDFPEEEVNGIFNRGDKLAKTEIQLRKLLKRGKFINEFKTPEFLKQRVVVDVPKNVGPSRKEYLKLLNRWWYKMQLYGDGYSSEHPGKKPTLQDGADKIYPPKDPKNWPSYKQKKTLRRGP